MVKNKKKELSFIKKNAYLILMCFVLLCLTTIGYSALNQKLYITGDLALRSVKDIRITNLELMSKTGTAYEQYNFRYTSDTASMYLMFPELNSSVTYKVTVNNYGDIDMIVDKLDISTSHSPITYTLDGIDETTIVKSKETLTFTITLTRVSDTNTSSEGYSALLELTWKDPSPKYTDPILAGNDPDLLNDSLTPVVYDEEQSSWVVADTTTEWYNYSNQEWANAVILEDGVTKNVGDTVLVPTDTDTATEVRAMYVWIPRYSYTIKSEDGTNYYGKTLSDLGGSTASKSTPGAIDIKFVSTDVVETGTAQYTGDTATNWRTHPAFQWDTNSDGTISASENIKGIWVGKFETSTDTSSTCYSSASSANCNDIEQEPRILPNVMTLRYQTMGMQFATSKKFSAYLSNSSNVDSHMMKNSEWGAVAYLSQSVYGKYGNSNYTGKYKEIYKNNSSNRYTGRSSGTYPTSGSSSAGTCYYNELTDRSSGKGFCGGGASTTGNITGIYDMSGGTKETVMGYLTTASDTWGATSSSNYAKFTEEPESKYYDAYTTTTQTTACNNGICYGHGLSETASWYSDTATFVSKTKPWFYRGGIYSGSSATGIMFFNYDDGSAGSNTFRAVLLKEG